MPLVSLHDIHHHYRGGVDVFAGVSFTVDAGEMVAITGPSGSGKSTLLQIVGGMVRPTAGVRQLACGDEEVRWVFQTPLALARRTVLDNVLLGTLAQAWGRRAAVSRARRTLAAVDLAGFENRVAGTLSGGELQRVQIARTLVGEPALVLADEPTGQLDRAATAAVVTAFKAALSSRTSLLIATHDQAVAGECPRRLDLAGGRLVDSTGGPAATKAPLASGSTPS